MSKFTHFSLRAALCASSLLLCISTSQAQTTSTNSTPPAPATQEDMGWWDSAKAKVNKILDEGDLSLMVAGHTHHGRGTYTKERIAELNEHTWGLGFSKAIRTKEDNEEMLYTMVISDSHFRPQPMAGYAYQWTKTLGDKVEVGGGATGVLISRTDYFGGIPFPVILPVASIGTRSTKLMATYVPRLSKNKGNGDVLFMFVRFELK
ncbi:hypothetical protein [Undibacterium pigrum]|uniref:Antimicrobial peptide resistance and lipid A acylation protein PagP n=1 Tax=Undibacterium pigrum TaxID=401470 RepID=A0A318J616_9BURK|nr:hypothetical protein [Undibacterium pigrum]PXX42592.1 antimicrobial peptide resistance and lipid A acylation protein PagP [Undibacterium pigrum]